MFRNLLFATCLMAAPATAAELRWGVTEAPYQQNDQTYCMLWYGANTPLVNFVAAPEYAAVSVASPRFTDIAEEAPIQLDFSGKGFETGPTQVQDSGVITGFVPKSVLDDLMANLAVAATYGADFTITLDGYVETIRTDAASDRVAAFASCRDQLPAGT